MIFNNHLLKVLEHFRIAKVDYAKNVTKYTEIQRNIVNSCIQELERFGFLERYTNTSIKRSVAKLKKSPEVHKHHTYFQITRSGIQALNSIIPRKYLDFLGQDCISLLAGKGKPILENEKSSKLIRMGLFNRRYEITGLGRLVLDELRRK